MVDQDTEKEHSNDSTGKRDGRDVLTGGGFGVGIGVDHAEHGIDRANDLAN